VRAQLQLLYDAMDSALEVERKARRLMTQLGQKFPEIARLDTIPGVGRIGAHLFVAYIQEPSRFETPQQLFRYCRLGIRDRSSDGKPLGFQQLDRCGHGVLKAISYRAWLAAMRQRSGTVHKFYAASLQRTNDETHARLNTQRKILHTMLVLWQSGQEFDPKRFLGDEAQLTVKATCG
jgi:transposase